MFKKKKVDQENGEFLFKFLESSWKLHVQLVALESIAYIKRYVQLFIVNDWSSSRSILLASSGSGNEWGMYGNLIKKVEKVSTTQTISSDLIKQLTVT